MGIFQCDICDCAYRDEFESSDPGFLRICSRCRKTLGLTQDGTLAKERVIHVLRFAYTIILMINEEKIPGIVPEAQKNAELQEKIEKLQKKISDDREMNNLFAEENSQLITELRTGTSHAAMVEIRRQGKHIRELCQRIRELEG